MTQQALVLENNYDITKLNTFGVACQAKFFVVFNTESDIQELLTHPEFSHNQKLFLGGGSNTLFTQNFDGLVILNKFLTKRLE